MDENDNHDLYAFLENPFYSKMIQKEGVSRTNTTITVLVLFSFLPVSFAIGYMCIQYLYFGDTRFKNIGSEFGFWIVFVINAYFSIMYIRAILNYHRSKSWIETNANILKINILDLTTGHYLYRYSVYRPYIRYQYKVGDKTFWGNRLSFEVEDNYNYLLDPELNNQQYPMNHCFAQWVEEQKVTIRYNPLKPYESVIFYKFNGGKFRYFYLHAVAIIYSLSLLSVSLVFVCQFF